MNKKILVVTLLSVLLIAYIPVVLAHDAPFPGSYDATAYTIDATGQPGACDPAYAYDTTAAGWIMNAYETLLFYDPLWSIGPYQPETGAQRVQTFVPQISSALPTVVHYSTPIVNPISDLPVYATFTFPIRTDITFHHGAFNDATPGLPPYRPAGPRGLSNWPTPLRMTSTGVLTPRDVEYSIERVMVQDRAAGPAWLLYEPLLGVGGAEDPAVDPDFGLKIDGAVEQVDLNSDGTMDAVRMYLANVFPDMAFKQILGQTWSCIMSEAWAANEGDLYMAGVTPLPGETNPWTNWAYIYATWNNPRPSLLDDGVDNNPIGFKDGGNGPYQIAYWTRGVAWSLQYYPGYYRGWPCPVPGSTARLPGYLQSVTWYLATAWATRLSDILTGTRETVAVPRNYRDQVLGQTVGGEKIRSYYPFTGLSGYALYFTMDIDPASTWVGTMQPANTFSTAGVPPNIFGYNSVTGADEGINVRKAFAAAWDYGYVITNAYLDEAEQPSDPIVKGLAYDDPSVPLPVYDLAKAEYYFKLAWGGSDPNGDGVVEPGDEGALWNGGMRMTCVYPTASVPYQLALEKMVPEINALGGEISPGVNRFQLSIGDLDWGTRFLPEMEEHLLPVFNVGWLADFADPHNFAYPFMHSEGDYGYCQQYNDPFVDALVEQGIEIPDPPTAGYEDTVVSPTYSAYKDIDYSGTLSVGDWLTVTGATYDMYEVTALAPLTATTNRERVYSALQYYYVDQCPSTMAFQVQNRGFQCAWVRGFYDNKLYPGNFYYHWWKTVTHFGDANNDGVVDTTDVSVLSAHWTGPPSGAGGFNPRGDLSGGTGGTVVSEYGLVRGIPDGKVDEIDKGIVNGYWGYPGVSNGPSHP